METWQVLFDIRNHSFPHADFLGGLALAVVIGLAFWELPRYERWRGLAPYRAVPAGGALLVGAVATVAYVLSWDEWRDLDGAAEAGAFVRAEVVSSTARDDGDRIDGSLAVRTEDGVWRYRFPSNSAFPGYSPAGVAFPAGTCVRLVEARGSIARIELRTSAGTDTAAEVPCLKSPPPPP